MTIIILILFSIFAIYIVGPSILKIVLRKRFLKRINPEYAYLTFDDGPHPDATQAILDLLKDSGVKATFFVLGENAVKHKQLMERIEKDGHEIGEHGHFHSHPWKASPFRSAIDLMKGKRALKEYTSRTRSVSFRPPYGKLNFLTLIYLVLMKRTPVFWNMDLKDFEHESTESISKIIYLSLSAGKVILLHDGRQNPNKNFSITIDAVKMILEKARQLGVGFRTIREGLPRK